MEFNPGFHLIPPFLRIISSNLFKHQNLQYNSILQIYVTIFLYLIYYLFIIKKNILVV